MPPSVLIYNTMKAPEYAQLVRSRLPEVEVTACASPDEAAAAVAGAEVIFGWRFPQHFLPHAGALRWYQNMGAGVEDLIAAPLPAGCQVTRIEGLFGGSMAEYSFRHMLEHAQQAARLRAEQDEARWHPKRMGRLYGKRLGVAGAGSIGAEIARIGQAFGMEVWALVRSNRSVPHADRVFTPAQAADFNAGVDYLVSSLPLTPETIGLVDPLQMKEGALLINVGRGATIDEGRILEAVRAGRIQAALDVFAVEPLPADHPFWSTQGITVTPHISGPSVPEEVAAIFVDNYRRYVAGEPLRGLVDRNRGY